MSQLMKKRFPSITSIDVESDGNTSFLRAARNGQLDKVLEHLKSNIDINTSNANGLNALHLASKDGHVDIVAELLKRGAVVDAATKKGNTALHIASLAGQEEVVKLLVQNGASVNVQSQNGFTPLYMAAQENHDNVVKYLLANGANQSLSTEDGFTPLAVAMQQGHDKVVTVLLENDTRGKIRLPALHIAAKKDDVKAAKLLLENEHNPDVTSKSGFTPLHIASHYGNQSIANLLIQKGADVNYSAKHNITPLHVAAKWGKTNMVALLLEHGATIESKTRDGLTPLHCAARSGHEQVVDMLLERGAPISSKTKNGLAPLHMAAQGDHVDAARILLYHRAPVDEVTVDYLTALHVAAHCGHVRVAKLLLDRQADANARALNGFTPLHIACKKNRIKVVELLLKHGACIGATTESGLTPLHVASFMGCMNIVIYLLQHDANPDVPTVRGETPLHLAARANQTDIIRILLRNGAQVDARAREQQTPLHIASRLGNVDIVMLLLQHGAKVDNTTKDMYTALHIAAKEGQDEVAAVLIDNGASLNATTKKGFTPLHLASKYGHLKVAKLLLQKEAPVDAQGKNGVTPLHVASHYDHQNVALLLLDKGASPHATAKNGHTPLHIAARKNQMDIANTLLEYGAQPNAESKAGFTPLHLSSQEGHTDMSSLLVEHKADTNHQAKNGLTPLHLCAQEDRVPVAEVLVKNGADVNAPTKAGYTPLHVASHYGQVNMVRFLLSNGADVQSTTAIGYTPLHQAAQQGHTNIVTLLLEKSSDPNAQTANGQTPLDIAQKLGYITVIDTLKVVTTTTTITTTTTTNIEEKYRVVAPEAMHEIFMSDSEEEGGEDTVLGDQTYRYLTADEMKSLGDDSLPIDVTRDERIDSNRMVSSADSNMLPPQNIEDNISPEHVHQNMMEFMKKYTPDNVDISRHPINIGFLVSFLVDARGGAMRGCRHSGVRVIVPPRCAASPTRITCRYVRQQRTPHSPPLMEGEALASRVLELGPVGAKFLGPVIIEVPHFAALRGKEREIVILRSDNGESWKEHTVEATEDVLNEVLHDSFDADDLNQLEDLSSGRITRIVTQDFPQYFAVVSRVRQEVHAIGPEGGMVSSTVVPQVQAVFPQGALTKKIKVGLQAQPIDPHLTAKLLGHGVAVSPVVTVEPRRRKFHKAITLSMPTPRAHSQGMINQYSGSAPTLRLLCSITGGTTRAQWEDVTGSTPLTFVNDCVSFTTTVSARFWLIDCRNTEDATKMATELYREAIHVPFMAKFVVFAKRVDPLEARLRVFCMTDDKEDKTLEHQEHFTEVAKSRDVEVLEGKPQYIEFGGNLVPITKSGEQLQFAFRAFRENRLPFSVRVKDQHAEAVCRCLFMKEPKVAKGEPSQEPICILNIVLPDDIVTDTISLTDTDSIKKHMFLSENFDYYRPDPRLADMSNLLGEDWVPLANQLGLTTSEINVIKSEYPDSVAKQAQSMLRMWLSQSGNKAQTNTLENALRRIGREDIIPQCLNVDQTGQGITRIKQEEIGKYRLKKDISLEPSLYDKDVIRQVDTIESIARDDMKPDNYDKYSAEEKVVEVSDEEDFNKTVTERRQQIEERLSAERTIPASSQRVEIVQEITSIKRQSIVEDKIAEVQQKTTPPEGTKTITKTIPEKKDVLETVEVKTTTIPSDSMVSGTDQKPQAQIVKETKTTTVVSETRTILPDGDEYAHKTAEDSKLLEGVTQSFETTSIKKPIPKVIADEDPNSPRFSKTPPPSPADFLLRDQAATVQEWDASKKNTESLSTQGPKLETDAAQQGKSTSTTQYLNSNEDVQLAVGESFNDLSASPINLVANLKTVYDQTNALIQSESRAEPYHPHTDKSYKILPEKVHDEKQEKTDLPKDEKKAKKGIIGTIKTFVSKSFDHSDSDSEKSPKKDKKAKKDKKKKKKAQEGELPPEVPTRPPRKPKLPTPPERRKDYDDIPYFGASTTDLSDIPPPYKPPAVPPTGEPQKKVSFSDLDLTKVPVTDLDADPDTEVVDSIKTQAKEIVTEIINDGENAAKDILNEKSPKSKRVQKVIVVEEVTKTFQPAAIEEEEFSIIVDPTKKESPRKSKETFTINIDESINQIEKELLEKSPILPEEKIVKPLINTDAPVRPPRINDHIYEDVGEPVISYPPDNLQSIPGKYNFDERKVTVQDNVKKITTDLIQNEQSFPGWSDDQHNVANKEKINNEQEPKITDSQKMKRKQGKLFGLFGKSSKDNEESDDESSIIEKQDKELSKEKTVEEVDESKKSGFLGLFGKKSKKEEVKDISDTKDKPLLSQEVIKHMEDTTDFLQKEVINYEDGKPILKKDTVVEPEKSGTKKEPKLSPKQTTKEIQETVKVTEETTLSSEVPIEEKVEKKENKKSPKLRKSKSKEREEKPKKADSDKGGFLGFFKKPKKDEDKDTQDSKPALLSEEVVKHMNDSHNFLQEEVERYHDVRPELSVKLDEAVESKTEKTEEKLEKEEKSGFFGIFKKSGKKTIDSEETKESSPDTFKDMHETTNFLNTELERYEDGDRITKTEISVQQTSRESELKEPEPVPETLAAPLSETVLLDMISTTSFLREEVTNYHDVRPTIKIEHEPDIPQESKEKGGKLFGIFGKKSKEPSTEREIKDPKQVTKESKQVAEESVPKVETKTVGESSVTVTKTEPVKTEVEEKKGFLSGLFSKKSKQEVEDTQKVEQTDEITTDLDTNVSDTEPFDALLKQMSDCKEFLHGEIENYHDVKILPPKSIAIKEQEKVEEPKESKGFLGGLFSKKQKEKEDKPIEETIEKDEVKQVHESPTSKIKPVLSQEVIQQIADTNSFINEEINRYHDVKSIPAQPTDKSEEKMESIEEKQAESKGSGFLGLFSKKSKDKEKISKQTEKEDKPIDKIEKIPHKETKTVEFSETISHIEPSFVTKIETHSYEDPDGATVVTTKIIETATEVVPKMTQIKAEADKDLDESTVDTSSFLKEQKDEIFEPKDVPEKVEKDKKSGLFGIFVKKKSEEREIVDENTKDEKVIEIVKSPEEEVAEAEKEKKSGIFGIFKRKSEERELPVEKKVLSPELKTKDIPESPLSAKTIKDMSDSSKFLQGELERYEDAKPVITYQPSVEETKVEKDKKSGVLFGIFGKKKSEEREPSEEKTIPKTEEELDSKQTKKERRKSGSPFRVFGKKQKSEDEVKKQEMSEEVIQQIADTKDFIITEVDKYEDVKLIPETKAITKPDEHAQKGTKKDSKEEKAEKRKSGGFFSIFTKDPEDQIEKEKTDQKQDMRSEVMERPPLSEETITNMRNTTNFLNTELNNYEDGRPDIMTTDLDKDAEDSDTKSSGLFSIFSKKDKKDSPRSTKKKYKKHKREKSVEEKVGFIEKIGRKLTSTVTDVKDAAEEVEKKTDKEIKDGAADIKDSTREIKDELTKEKSDLEEKATETVNDVISKAELIISEKDNTIIDKKQLKLLDDSIDQRIKQISDNIQDDFSDIKEKTTDNMVGIENEAHEIGAMTENNLFEAIQTTKESIQEVGHETKEEITNLMKKVDANLEDVSESVIDAEEKLKDKSIGDLKKVKKDLEEDASEISRNTAETVEENVVHLSENLEKGVQKVGKKTGGFFSKLGEKISGKAEEVKEVSKDVKDTLVDKTETLVEKTDTAAKDVVEYSSKIIDNTKTFGKETMAEGKDASEKAAKKTGGFFSKIGEKISGKAEDLKDSAKSGKDKIEDEGQQVIGKLNIAIEKKGNEAEIAIKDIKQHTEQTVESVKDDLKDATDNVEATATDIKKSAKKEKDKKSKKIGGFFSKLGDKISNKSEEIKESVTDIKGAVVTDITVAKDVVVAESEKIATDIKTESKELGEKAKDTKDYIAESILTTKDDIDTKVATVKDDSSSFVNELMQSFDTKLEHVKDKISEKEVEIKTEVDEKTEFVKDTKATLSDALHTSKEITADVVDTTETTVEKMKDNVTEEIESSKEHISGKKHEILSESKQISEDLIQAADHALTKESTAFVEDLTETVHDAKDSIKLEEKLTQAKDETVKLSHEIEKQIYDKVSEGKEDIEKGKDEVKEALLDIDDKLKQVKDDTAKVLADTEKQTLDKLKEGKESITTEKDKLKDTLHNIKTEALDVALTTKDEAKEVLEDAKDKASKKSGFFSKFGDKISGKSKEVKDTSKKIKKSQSDIKDKSEKIAEQEKQLEGSIGQGISTIKELTKQTSKTIEKSTKDVTNEAVELLSGIHENLTDTTRRMEDGFQTAAEDLKSEVKEVSDDVHKGVESKLTEVKHDIDTTLDNTKKEVEEMSDRAHTKLGTTLSDINKDVDIIIEDTKATAQNIDDGLKEKSLIIDKNIRDTKETLKTTAESASKKATDISKDVSQAGHDIILDLDTKISEKTQKFEEGAHELKSDTVNKLNTVVMDKKEDITTISAGIHENIKENIEKAKDSTEKFGADTKTVVGGFIDTIQDECKETATNVEKSISQPLRSFETSLERKSEESDKDYKSTTETSDNEDINQTGKKSKSKKKSSSLLGKLGRKLSGKGDDIKGKGQQDKSKADEIPSKVKESSEKKSGFFSKLGDKIAGKASDVQQEVPKIHSQTADTVLDIVDKQIEKTTSDIEQTKETVKSDTKGIKDSLQSDISSAESKIIDKTSVIVGEIDRAVGDVTSNLTQKAEDEINKKDEILTKINIITADTKEVITASDNKVDKEGKSAKENFLDTKQKTKDFLDELRSASTEHEHDTLKTDTYGSMTRTISDNVGKMDHLHDNWEEAFKISETNIDLSNFPAGVEYVPKKTKLSSTKSDSTSYVTSPTMSRRTVSQRLPNIERPVVKEVTSSPSGELSDDESYIVTEPEELQAPQTKINVVEEVKDDAKKKPLFHLESEDDESFDIGAKATERRDSVKSNVLETLTEVKLDNLLSDLTKNLQESTTDSVEIPKDVIKKEGIRLEEHKKEAQVEVDMIEQKLRDLDKALDSLEQVEVAKDISNDDPKIEKKLKRVERKFERMASEAIEKEVAVAKVDQMTTPEIEEKREKDFQRLVSQLSTEEVSDFQREYSHLWDEHTFSKSDEWDSKTPDSQADAQELPQGEEASSSAVEPEASSSLKAEGEETQNKDKSGKPQPRQVTDQHQLSEEMKELLKQLEKDSKQ